MCTQHVHAQSCSTLCDSTDCSPPDSVHGIFQARILKWVAISFSGEFFWPRNQTQVSCCISCIAGGFFTAKPPGKPTKLWWQSESEDSVELWVIYTQTLNYNVNPFFTYICLLSQLSQVCLTGYLVLTN